ncbi:hypothetical protein ACIQ9E_07205 [Streptomyces sp. NPDC094448]
MNVLMCDPAGLMVATAQDVLDPFGPALPYIDALGAGPKEKPARTS